MNRFQRYRARQRGEDIPLMKPGKKPMDNLKRFEKHFVKTDGCWLWIGYRHKFGYGKFKLWPERADRDAHRVSYLLYVGEITDSLFVLHKCHVPACVNPKHLYLGTQARNVRDMIEAGRQNSPPPLNGEANPSAKLTASQVKEIRKQRSAGIPIERLSMEFCISRSQIRRIIDYHSWTSLQ